MDKVYSINGHEVNFYCNEENRIVKATIKGCDDDVFESLKDDFGLNIDHGLFTYTAERHLSKIEMPRIMSCIAHCHPDDVFDKELGKRVAYKKLRKKYWSKYAKRMYNLRSILVDAAIYCSKDAEKAYGRADQITQ